MKTLIREGRKGEKPFRIEIKQSLEGWYVYVYENEDSEYPEKDYLENSEMDARLACFEDFGIDESEWRLV